APAPGAAEAARSRYPPWRPPIVPWVARRPTPRSAVSALASFSWQKSSDLDNLLVVGNLYSFLFDLNPVRCYIGLVGEHAGLVSRRHTPQDTGRTSMQESYSVEYEMTDELAGQLTRAVLTDRHYFLQVARGPAFVLFLLMALLFWPTILV